MAYTTSDEKKKWMGEEYEICKNYRENKITLEEKEKLLQEWKMRQWGTGPQEINEITLNVVIGKDIRQYKTTYSNIKTLYFPMNLVDIDEQIGGRRKMVTPSTEIKGPIFLSRDDHYDISNMYPADSPFPLWKAFMPSRQKKQ